MKKIAQAQVVIYLFDTESIFAQKSSIDAITVEIKKIKNKYPQKPLVVLANKMDAITEQERSQLTIAIPDIKLISAKNKKGIEELKLTLSNFVNTGALRNDETIVTNTRHYDALLKAFEEIQKVKYGLDSGLSGDLMAIDIRQALFHFGEITGEITTDDLLGNIFANFCIGK